MKGFFFALVVFCTSISFADAAEFSASWSHDSIFPGKFKVITLVARDNTTITGVTVNRGHCKLAPAGWTKFPVKVQFGQAINLKTYYNCQIIELAVSTPDGVSSIQW